MGGREQFNTRLEQDRAQVIREVADEHDLDKSEVTRRFIQRGMDADSRAQKFSDDLRSVATNLWVIAAVVFGVGLFMPLGTRQVLIYSLMFMTMGACAAILSDYLEPEGVANGD